jgi:hypothetical protein
MIITLGDSRQIQPVRDMAIWQEDESAEIATKIWSSFTDVVILIEQMRQKDDMPYQELLGRASECCLTNADLDLLNSKTRENMTRHGQCLESTALRPLNAERHDLNRLAIERFAKTRNQKVWMFAAKHSRTKSPMARNSITVASLLNLRLFVVVWIHLQDGGCAPNQARLIGRVDS